MKIAYCARFDQALTNDDEGAIIHALRELGHEVTPCREEMARRWLPKMEADLLLFHKLHAPDLLEAIRPRFKRIAFWYFDLVDFPDPLLAARCEMRRRWMTDTVPLVDLGFCTDGDWVANSRRLRMGSVVAAADKLRWLPQGADERLVGRGNEFSFQSMLGLPPNLRSPDILFTGIGRGGGRQRVTFVEEMRERWGDRFVHVERGVHGETLKELVARSKVVVAPDSPVTDRYWSNRVWLLLGFGAFLLHPWSNQLAGMYEDGKELRYYCDRKELHGLISFFLDRGASERKAISDAALQRTKAQHLYRHRCEELIRQVEELP